MTTKQIPAYLSKMGVDKLDFSEDTWTAYRRVYQKTGRPGFIYAYGSTIEEATSNLLARRPEVEATDYLSWDNN